MIFCPTRLRLLLATSEAGSDDAPSSILLLYPL
jgi:hypothetical protein